MIHHLRRFVRRLLVVAVVAFGGLTAWAVLLSLIHI